MKNKYTAIIRMKYIQLSCWCWGWKKGKIRRYIGKPLSLKYIWFYNLVNKVAWMKKNGTKHGISDELSSLCIVLLREYG